MKIELRICLLEDRKKDIILKFWDSLIISQKINVSEIPQEIRLLDPDIYLVAEKYNLRNGLIEDFKKDIKLLKSDIKSISINRKVPTIYKKRFTKVYNHLIIILKLSNNAKWNITFI